MPYGEVTLVPGVNTERTPTLLQAGVSVSQFIRYKDSLIQKLGGWQKLYANAVAGTPRDLHAWQDLNSTKHLAVGTTTQLNIITGSSLSDITPQTVTTNPATTTPSPGIFSTTAGSPIVTIDDTGISNVTILDAVLFNTPVSVGGIVLAGIYQITQIVGPTTYNITAPSNATSTVTNGGAVPVFTTASGSASVSVALAAHGLSVGNTAVFRASTTGNGVTIQGSYTVATVADANNFTITANTQATAAGSFSMNGGNAQFVYYINLGPPAAGAGYGTGGYGEGGYGTGTVSGAQTGAEITSSDWTSDNWGQLLLACPDGGGVYSFDPTGGFINAGLIATAPPFNGGIFVNMGLQMLICWASTQRQGLGLIQDPLLVRWSTDGDFTQFTPLATNQAGSFRLSNGSTIRGGMAATNQNLIWTDLDLWAMGYIGFPLVFSFNKIGAGAGMISSHAAQTLRGNVYWMGPSNFFAYDSGGVHVVPCPVWDFVFQNLSTGSDGNGRPFTANIRAMPNTPFNEVGWEFPSAASANGENDSYVKFNVTEPGAPWDYGMLPRSAWIDQTVLGPPVAATPTGLIYQHETSPDADGQPLTASFTTGEFYIAAGEEYAFVDRIIPDFKWGTFAGAQTAQVNISFNVMDYPGGTPTVYGPFLMTSTTQFISVRFRGGLMSITVSSSDVGSFWRLGKVRYRYAPCGRR
jgi:hypothetical protein